MRIILFTMNTKRKFMQIYINFYRSGLSGLFDFAPSILFKIFCPGTKPE